jgi:hypothetical protein
MNEIKPMLCKDSHGDAYVCIDCTSSCDFGKRAVELLEKETKGLVGKMSKKQICDASRRVEAMENYLEAMSAPDPVGFVIQKYGCENIRIAKNKIYQWQHNYGTNLGMISNRIREIKDEIAASQTNVNKDPVIKKDASVKENLQSNTIEDKKLTKRQEDKISQSHLEQMRLDYEDEYLKLAKQIEDYKKEIEECENKMENIVDRIKSIRAVLDIFKEKDAKYV